MASRLINGWKSLSIRTESVRSVQEPPEVARFSPLITTIYLEGLEELPVGLVITGRLADIGTPNVFGLLHPTLRVLRLTTFSEMTTSFQKRNDNPENESEES